MAKTLDAAGVKRLIQEIKGANKNLNAPIPISTENTPESKAQNVKNIADYVEKAKAAGIANVNGMAVTCIIDNDYSGVGYLYGDTTNVTICGIMLTDDAIDGKFFSIQSTGEYNYNIIISSGDGNVNSGMLDQGARNPIILTPNTTEVDEETYQKLLSDDVDVVFKDETGNPLYLNFKESSGNDISLGFGYIITRPISAEFPYGYSVIVQIIVTISSATPHKLVLSEPSEVAYKPDEFIDKSILSPVLQEIDLIGTDAERKAKLDQFETDWKALTGADDLTGARFVGKFGITDDVERNVTGIMTYSAGDTATKANDNCFYGICNGYSFSKQKSQIAVKVSCKNGSLTITPLFSHLEAVTIYTDNTPEHKQANLDNIAAYKANLQALGVDVTKGYMIPVTASGRNGFLCTRRGDYPYAGYVSADSTVNDFYNILILRNGEYYNSKIQTIYDNNLQTTTKQIVGAINEINANAVHSDKLVPTLEAITIKTGNTPEDKAANVEAIKAYVDNLKALGVDVTKGYVIPCKLPGSVGGILSAVSNNLMVAITTNERRELNCYEVYIGGNDLGRVYWTGGFQLKIASNLTTTSKQIVGAINEVNALAKGYSTIFTPIELTTETAQNKTAIDARVAAFTAQGISLTNGCCIPVTYKGVYAGNISLINGDWYGLLVKNTNNPADNINIKLSADGTITEGNSAQ